CEICNHAAAGGAQDHDNSGYHQERDWSLDAGELGGDAEGAGRYGDHGDRSRRAPRLHERVPEIILSCPARCARMAPSTLVNAAGGFVPIIDIRPFLTGDAAQKSWVAKEVDKACRKTGFYVIVGHGVEQSLLERTEAVSRAFFALPAAEKMRLHRDLTGETGSAGYTAIGDNNLSYTRGEALPFDLNETIQIAPIDTGDDDYYREGAARGMFPPNRWPESLPEFKEIYVEYFRRMLR